MRKSTGIEILQHGEGRFGLIGSVDFDNAGWIMAAGQKLFVQHDSIVVDMSEAVVSNTAGLALLMEWASWCDIHDKRLCYDGLQASALAVAELNGVTMMLPVVAQTLPRSEAVRSTGCTQ